MRPQDEAGIVACIPHLRRYARGLSSDREHADDLVQDTLERAWGKYSMWQKSGEVRAWMFGIMHNLFIDQMRSERSRPEHYVGDNLPDVPDRATQLDRLEVHDLDRVLRRLPPDLREVLLLIGVEELSYKDAAGILRVPIGTVMSRLSRARERLRAEIDGRTPVSKIQSVK